MKRWRLLVLAVAVVAPLVSACADESPTLATAPGCTAYERLGLVAQSVPSASYVPCVVQLPTGWQSSGLDVRNGSTRFDLLSDRAQGHAVRVELRSSCDPSAGAPIPPRTIAGRTYLALTSIDPDYAGTMYDVFPGGCVTYRFDFRRGPHIALMADLASSVGYVSRAELKRMLRQRLGVELE